MEGGVLMHIDRHFVQCDNEIHQFCRFYALSTHLLTCMPVMVAYNEGMRQKHDSFVWGRYTF